MVFVLTRIGSMSLMDVGCFQGRQATVRADDSGFLVCFSILSLLDVLLECALLSNSHVIFDCDGMENFP